MLKKLMFIFSNSVLLASSYDYTLHMEFKRGKTSWDKRFVIMMNNKQVMCVCGKEAVYLLFYFGYPTGYCSNCLPIHPVQPKSDIDKLCEDYATTYNLDGINGVNDDQAS